MAIFRRRIKYQQANSAFYRSNQIKRSYRNFEQRSSQNYQKEKIGIK